ncbi:hypothetical protein HRbin17_00658 [bacterium HR17]|uniref:Uncharacterized protein n=1 Tax=Candidatus Fervidibacter japonicus TaxID=2035412 RepID=A0A2H5XAE6_9BACT|nr:hypothetical protein HRbin17_00658 [bacterium HR17]
MRRHFRRLREPLSESHRVLYPSEGASPDAPPFFGGSESRPPKVTVSFDLRRAHLLMRRHFSAAQRAALRKSPCPLPFGGRIS